MIVDRDALARADELLSSGRVCTCGRAALIRALQIVNTNEVAARVRVTHGAVSNWATARTRPSRRARQVLLDAYGIDVDLWEQPVTNGD